MTVSELIAMLQKQPASSKVMLRLCYGGYEGELGVAYTLREGNHIVALEAYESAHDHGHEVHCRPIKCWCGDDCLEVNGSHVGRQN